MNDNNADKGNYLPGLKPVLELLEREPGRVDQVFLCKGRPGRDTDRILDLCRQAGVRFSLAPDETLARLAQRARHQGVVARLRENKRIEWPALLAAVATAPLPLIVALDQVQDPGNVGTLARTLYALGAAGMVFPRHNSAFLGPGARRAAAGALERLPMAEVVNLTRAVEDAAEAGLTTYAAMQDPDSLNVLAAPLSLPALLVLGNEDKGVRRGVARHCDFSLNIPFRREFDSLNVAQAGGIIASCFARGQAHAQSVFPE